MAVVQLASSTDVVAALGRALTLDEAAKVGAILDKASELFRAPPPRGSGQQFTPGTSTVRLKVNGGKVYLPQRPANAVSAVFDDDGNPVTFTLDGQWLTVPFISHQFVRVSYSHGGTVPDLVRLTIADIARKVLSIDKNAASGATQHSETSGPFTDSWTYASWALGGQTMLAPDDVAIADSFRVKIPNVWIQRV